MSVIFRVLSNDIYMEHSHIVQYCLMLPCIDLKCLTLTNIVQWRPLWTSFHYSYDSAISVWYRIRVDQVQLQTIEISRNPGDIEAFWVRVWCNKRKFCVYIVKYCPVLGVKLPFCNKKVILSLSKTSIIWEWFIKRESWAVILSKSSHFIASYTKHKSKNFSWACLRMSH